LIVINSIAIGLTEDREPMLQILGICGSLRKGSYNALLLRAYEEWLPPETRIETVPIDEIPPYNEDVRQVGFPPSVGLLRRQIQAADALLIVTPEYNYSIPGVLKNAIDWASRPPDQPFNEKPIALTGASPGMLGSARAQYDLRRCFVFLNAFVLNQPEVMLAKAHERFDKNGKLTHQGSQKLIEQQLEALVAFVARVRPRG
jgi:chromate reductase